MKSKIEELILSRDFPYMQPYFYNHPWALRCELGRGKAPEEFVRTARERAEAIYRILFPASSPSSRSTAPRKWPAEPP